ncbi:MAG: thioredoxin domain-containing protein [Chitinophagaceae bacterium]
MKKFTNKLIEETSPYLLQHAHNPVNWYPWGEEALQKAKDENRPILVSIGYSACHWCHVMERESFEDEATAKLMNENFINIKIDREERPDLDHIYMDAVQAMTGSGGWPLNVFLTPNAKPFYGGTYFPPQRAYNRPSWQETLLSVSQAFKDRRHEIDAQSENLTEHLLKASSFGFQKEDNAFTKEKCNEAFQNIMKNADKEWGGFGKAPKFPQTFSIQFLLRYYQVTQDIEALTQALHSLDKMIEGGIYDQIGGGFARYATDTEWLAPHFEKMLYDNALLVSVLSEAFQLTKKERYKDVIEETMEFIQRELLHEKQNGFYAALDADSEGVEGKFYVWSFEEVKKALGEYDDLYCAYYDVSESGNWEHTNILRVKKPIKEFAEEKKIAVDKLKKILAAGNTKLLQERSKRIRPLLDDKIILGWNALMNIACCKAYSATGKEEYRQLAIDNMNFLLLNLKDKDADAYHHTFKGGKAKFPAFLDDYSFLIEALICLQEITADKQWIEKAKTLTEYVIQHFTEEETGFFFYTPAGQKDIIVRKKEVYDGAVPSGNSVMAYNLLKLGLLFDKKEWSEQCRKMASSLSNAISKYPVSFGNWASLLLEITEGTQEIAIAGAETAAILKEVLAEYIPHRVIMATEKKESGYPLLTNKQVLVKTSIFLCRNYTCLKPVFSVKELMLLINKAQKS